MKPGDRVRFRDDATTEGQPIGQLFRELTWVVLAVRDDMIELSSRVHGTGLKMYTLTHKLRHATPEEIGS